MEFLIEEDDSEIIRTAYQKDLSKLKELLTEENLLKINDIRDYRGRTLLHIASEIGSRSLDIVNYLLQIPSINVNAVDHFHKIPLMYAVEGSFDANQDLVIINNLLTSGANVNAVNADGGTALHDAINGTKASVIVVSNLLLHGADPAIENHYGYVPLTIALEYQNEELQWLLMENMSYFNINTEDETLLQCAIRNKSPIVRELMARGADINEGTFPHSTYLLALTYGDLDLLKTVINRYIEPFDHEYSISLLVKLLEFWDLTWENLNDLVDFIINCDNVQQFVRSLTFHEDLYKFIRIVYNSFLDVTANDKLRLFIRITKGLMKHGYQPVYLELWTAYELFQFSSLFELLILTDIDPPFRFANYKAVLFFHLGEFLKVKDIKLELYSLMKNGNLSSTAAIGLAKEVSRFTCDPIFLRIFNSLPYTKIKAEVPLLVDLARNAARDCIIHRYDIGGYKEYYELINKCVLSPDCRNLLKFRSKLYDFVGDGFSLQRL